MARKVFFADRVKKVDVVGKNVLIRSCMPLVDDPYRFAYEEVSAAAGVHLPDYDLHDVSLIDCVGERYLLEPEMDSFGIACPGEDYWPPYERDSYRPWVPSVGALRTELGPVAASLYWWPIEGLPEGQDPSVFLGAPGWNLSGLVELLTSLMSDQSGKQKAVLLHCTLGADRTGAAHTSYLVRKGAALDAAILKADASTSAGSPNEDYKRLRAAYAHAAGR